MIFDIIFVVVVVVVVVEIFAKKTNKRETHIDFSKQNI